MAQELVIRKGLKILGTLGSGVSDDILTLDGTTKDVGKIPSLDLSAYLTNVLPTGQIFIGVANVATPTVLSGDITISTGGVTSIVPGVIIDSDISTGAAIAYGKLNLANSIVNGDISTVANIARTKLASGTVNRILTNNGAGQLAENIALTGDRVILSDINGLLVSSGVTATTLGFVDATSSIQTQLNNKLAFSSAITPVDGNIVYFTGGVWSNLAVGTNGQVLTLSGGLPTWSAGVANGLPTGGASGEYLAKTSGLDYAVAWTALTLNKVTDVTATAAEVNKLAGVTTTTAQFNFINTLSSNAQSQLDLKLDKALTLNSLFIGNISNVAVALATGANGTILTSVGGVPTWAAPGSGGTVTSVNVSGGTTGLSYTGGPITTNGTITLAGTLIPANGGTGLTAIGTALQYLRVNAGATALEYATLPTIISGTTGSVDNALLRADGTGGVTLQSSGIVITDNADIDLGITASTGGALRTIQARGTAADIGITLTTKGAGDFTINSNYVAVSSTTAVALETPIVGLQNTANPSAAPQLHLLEATVNGSDYIGFTVPTSLAATVLYTLPPAPAVSGYVLSSTTGGVMSWVAAGGGGSYWDLATGGTLTGNNTINHAGFNVTFAGTGKVTFSPSATLSGFNFGSVAGIPSGLSNGDAWYNSTVNTIGVRVNGSTGFLMWQQGTTLNAIPYYSSVNGFYNLSANLIFDGTALLVGGGTVTANTRVDIRGISGGNALRVANDVNVELWRFDNAGVLWSGSGRIDGLSGASAIRFAASQTIGSNSSQLQFSTLGGTYNGTSMYVSPGIWTGTTGDFSSFGVVGNFAPVSGTATHRSIVINPIINTTGSYSGTAIGVDYNPTLTSITGLTHIAFRSTSGGMRLEHLALGTATPLSNETKAIHLINSTAAGAGAQQNSPYFIQEGRGWETTGPSSQSVKVAQWVIPVQGTINPSAIWKLATSVNGGAYTDLLSIQSNGGIVTMSTLNSSNGTFNSNLQIGTAALSTATSNQLFLGGGFNAGVNNARGIFISYPFNIASGSMNYSGLLATPTYNFTGTHSGGSITFFDYNPTVNTLTGINEHIAYRSTSGAVVFGSTSSDLSVSGGKRVVFNATTNAYIDLSNSSNERANIVLSTDFINGATAGRTLSYIAFTNYTATNKWNHAFNASNGEGGFGSGITRHFGTPSNGVSLLNTGAASFEYRWLSGELSVNLTGGTTTLIGYNWSPSITGTTGLTHLAWRNTSGQLLFGGTTITAGSVLADFQSSTQGIVVPRPTAIANITTPANGMVAYDATTHKFNFRENGAWVTIGAGGGISNTAANNEIMKSNGTNAVPSGIFSTTAGNLKLGTSIAGTERLLEIEGSATDVDFKLITKGANSFLRVVTNQTIFYNTSQTNYVLLTADSGAGSGLVNAYISGTPSANLFEFKAASGISGSIDAQTLSLRGGDGFNVGNSNAGNVDITSGIPNGSGAEGSINIQTRAAGKLGFFNATAVIKQSAATTPQGIADVLTAYGLLPTSTIAGGSGDVVGPASAVDNAIARFDTTTGKLIQNSSISISDTARLTLGTASLAGGRDIYTDSSDSSAPLNFVLKGGAAMSVRSVTPGATANFAVYDGWLAATGGSTTPSQGAYLSLQRGRGNISGYTAIINGDVVGDIKFYGGDGSAYYMGAQIRAVAAGTIASTSVPMDLKFFTGTGGAADVNTLERMAITSVGNISLLGTITNWQSMLLGMYVAGATTNPTGNPTGGAFFYADAADSYKPKWRVPGGTTYDLSATGAGGNASVSTVSTSTALSITGTSQIVRGNLSSSITTTLPTAVGNSGYIIWFKRVDATAFTWTIDGATTETIDGQLDAIVSGQWTMFGIYSNGTNWEILS